MPDTFGQETPQEAIARVQGAFRQQNQRFQNSAAANDPGRAAGQALANIFGGVTKQFFDTRRDRKSAAERIASTQNISMQEARKLAKEQVGFGHTEVRRAGQFRKASEEANTMVDVLTAEIGPELARASGMIMQARKLREMGFPQEATAMTLEAGQIRQAEEARLLGIQETKSSIRARDTSTEKTLLEIEGFDDTSFVKLTNKAETLRAEIENSSNPDEIAGMERQLGHIESQIAKLNTIIGTSEFDPSNLSKAGRNKQATEIIESEVLLAQLGDLEDILVENKGDIVASLAGRLGEKALGFMEDTFNRTPSESEEAFMARVRDQQGSSAFIAAGIRHALTGAAMSPAEAVFLEPFLPLPNDARTVALNKVRVIQKYTQLSHDIRQQLLNDPLAADGFMRSLERQAAADARRDKKNKAAVSTGTATQGVDKSVQDALDASNAINGNN